MNAEPMTAAPSGVARTSLLRTFFAILFTPARAMERPISWLFAYIVSGSAFGMLFLQTGLDLVRAGKATDADLIRSVGIGIGLGTVGVMIIATVVWAGIKLSGGQQELPTVMKAIGLAYGPALLYGLCGLILNLTLHWNTAVAFGVTGMLWALGPVSAIIRQFTNEKMIPALLLTTLCGAAMMAGWALLGGVL